MTMHRYVAAGVDGRLARGLVDAAGPGEAMSELLRRGLHPIELAPAPEVGARRPAPRRDLSILFRSLASLVGVGLPVDRALRTTAAALPAALRGHLAEVEDGVREGQSLSQALRRTRGLVPEGVIGMLEAGERASRLAEALDQVAAHLEQEAEFLARLRGALAYPVVLLAVGVLSLGIIVFVILPRFAVLLADVGQAAPPATRALLAVGIAARAWAPVLPFILAAVLAIVLAALRRPQVRLRLAEALLDFPVIGPLRRTLVGARWLRALATALASGLTILPALRAAAEASGDPAIRERSLRAAARIAEGEGVTAALNAAEVLTPEALQVLGIGEGSGHLALMARRAAEVTARDGERRLQGLVRLLEPSLVLTFGCLVAGVAAALLQAVYALRPTP